MSVSENDCNKKESEKQVVESSNNEVESAKNKDQELIVIQDSLYPIKLLVPGGEVVEIQVCFESFKAICNSSKSQMNDSHYEFVHINEHIFILKLSFFF